jgi:hypothetical protein
VAIAYGRAQIIGRSSGRSAVACAAYRSGQRLEDERQGITHDYERKGGIVAEGVMLPKDAPEWMRDREQLWNAVERREDRQTRRDTAQLAREFVIALPHELDDEAREYLVKNIVKEGATRKGMVADYAIHEPNRDGNDKNFHAHIMLTLRELDASDPDGFGNKAREWNSRQALESFKGVIERETNRMLKRHGIEDGITFVLEEGKEPQRHLGKAATQLERQGIRTDVGDENRAIEARNQERASLREAAAEIERRQRDEAPEIVAAPLTPEAHAAALASRGDDTAARFVDKIESRAEIRAGFEAAKDEATTRAQDDDQGRSQEGGDHAPGTTAAIAADRIRTAQDPVRHLRGWLDEDRNGWNQSFLLPAGPFASLARVDGVRPLRETEGPARSLEDRERPPEALEGFHHATREEVTERQRESGQDAERHAEKDRQTQEAEQREQKRRAELDRQLENALERLRDPRNDRGRSRSY